MDLTTEQQIFEQIKKSSKILLFLPENVNADSLGSCLALRLFLNKLQKDVTVVSSATLPENLKFLPGVGEIKKSLALGKSLVVTVDASVKKLEEISYQIVGEKVHIYLKAQHQEFTAEDLSFTKEKFPADLIITIDCKSLDSLGKVYEQYADLFYETPKINIDNKPANEYYGTINLVDVTASSVAEILSELFQKYEQQLVDEDMATCLLTGIISKTNSFQHIQTTPHAFLKASELVALGGRQQEVIKNIFKTKSLPLLKLWGRALAKMKIQEDIKLIYSVLNSSDFEKSESTEAEVMPVLKEFLDNISGYNTVALITESDKGHYELTAAVHEQVSIDTLIQKLGGAAKVFNFNIGNYKLLQIMEAGASAEFLENKFLEALKI